SLLQRVMERCTATLPAMWESNRRSRRSMSRRNAEDERYDPQIEHHFLKAICRFALQLDPEAACSLLEPVLSATPRFPEEASGVVKWLVLFQGDRSPAPTFWTLWQRLADDFVRVVEPARVDEEHSDQAKMLRELFLGGDWNEQRDWLPLHGETERLRSLFRSLPPTRQGFECYSYYLAKI